MCPGNRPNRLSSNAQPQDQTSSPALLQGRIGVVSQTPGQALIASFTPTNTRPKPRQLVVGSPYDIASRRDPNSFRYSPAYADTLEAAVNSNVPLSRDSRRPMQIEGGLHINAILRRTEANVHEASSTRVAAPDSSPTPQRPADGSSSIVVSASTAVSKPRNQLVKVATQPKATRKHQAEDKAAAEAAKKEKKKRDNRERQRVKRAKDKEEMARESLSQSVASKDEAGDERNHAPQQKFKAPSPPHFNQDFGPEGEEGGSAEDVVVSFMVKDDYIRKHKISHKAGRRILAKSIQAELRSRGMSERPLDNIVKKVGTILQRVTGIADKLRTQTGFGPDDGNGQTMDQWLKAQPDGPLYLQLESIVRDMHSINPLLIHDSASDDTLTAREDLLALLIKPRLDEADLSETEKEDNDDGDDQDPEATLAAGEIVPTEIFGNVNNGKAAVGKKTGPAARPTKSSTEAPTGSTWTSKDERKGKCPQEIGKLVTSRLDAHLDHVRERSQKQDEHLIWKQRRAEDQLAIERRKDMREQEAHEAAKQHQERLNQIALADHYSRLVLKEDHDEEIAGEIVFRPTAWGNLRESMMALVAGSRKRKRGDQGGDSGSGPELKRQKEEAEEEAFRKGLNCIEL
ncbi:hypothetical protein QFC19_008906 [Naganishia cerealis]|uniref:Uncharacterized protein n=1 Tax=Naganishia cerealis TaxID=610337 RepID=A0ACC2UYE0_9TREE|nr:hypothetical protein QFC19_008906 [Naganishia cerealis]